jgi:PTH1 family peptidyl-tRNA hydrolase
VKIIMGLGNPGREYEGTRHNAAWWFLDHLAATWPCEPWRKDRDTHVSDGYLGPLRVRLVKPQTFMNLSGATLRSYMGRAAFDPTEDLLVVVDDIAIPVGEFRFRASGSTGGHNGLKSIQQRLGSDGYPRLRLGIGQSSDEQGSPGGSEGLRAAPSQPEAISLPGEDWADFVLAPFLPEEREVLGPVLGRAADCVLAWLDGADLQTLMGTYNN